MIREGIDWEELLFEIDQLHRQRITGYALGKREWIYVSWLISKKGEVNYDFSVFLEEEFFKFKGIDFYIIWEWKEEDSNKMNGFAEGGVLVDDDIKIEIDVNFKEGWKIRKWDGEDIINTK